MISFQYFEGCPNSTTTLNNLRTAAQILQIPEEQIEMVEVADQASAESLHFQGSPSILIDGEDLFTGVAPLGFRYSCRIYPFDGRQPGVIPESIIVQRLQNYRSAQ